MLVENDTLKQSVTERTISSLDEQRESSSCKWPYTRWVKIFNAPKTLYFTNMNSILTKSWSRHRSFTVFPLMKEKLMLIRISIRGSWCLLLKSMTKMVKRSLGNPSLQALMMWATRHEDFEDFEYFV